MSQHTEILPPPPGSDAARLAESPAVAQQEDYFGFQEFSQFLFPDGLTYIEFEKMNEGKRAKFQKASSRDLVLERGSGNARMKVDPGGDRWALIIASCTDWNLKRGSNRDPILFSERNLREFLELANPKLIDDLEQAIRKANPWLVADMSPEDIQKEIDQLEELKREAIEREAGKATSSSK